MSLIKNENEIAKLRVGGKHLAHVLHEVKKSVRPGVSARELDELALKSIREFGDIPAFLNYKPYGADRPFPATLCVSVNDEVVHGIPNEREKILKEGDIVGLDIGLIHEGIVVDMAETVAVGNVSNEALQLIEATRKALVIGIAAAQAGARIYDIGCAIEAFAKPLKYGIVEDLGGHGVGHKVHEEPYIPNFCMKGKSPEIKTGMVLALEPMLNEGTKHVVLDDDGYTFKTADQKLSAHFEHTILITEHGPEVITVR